MPRSKVRAQDSLEFTVDELHRALVLQTRVLRDIEPVKPEVDFAYIFAQTRSNQDSVMATGGHLCRLRFVRKLGVCSTEDTKHGYDGFSAWKDRLIHPYGVHREDIIPIPLSRGNIANTLVEAEGIVRYAKDNNIKSIYIIAPPFHLARAFITTVTVLRAEYRTLLVYNKPGVALPWGEQAVHSQGVHVNTRAGLITDEWARIKRWQAGGLRPLCSVEQALAYLDSRDKKTDMTPKRIKEV